MMVHSEQILLHFEQLLFISESLLHQKRCVKIGKIKRSFSVLSILVFNIDLK